MISTHFDLQNIIKEMESAGNGAESSVNATGSEFSATITRVLESLPHDIESETELVDSLMAGGDESLESGKKDDGEHESGNVLPLMLSQPPSFDQLTLGGKRPILIGKLNAEQRSGISLSEATESTYALANGTVPVVEGSNLSRFDKAPDRGDSLHFKFAESSKGQIEAVKASSEQIHFSKNLDRLYSVGTKFERAELAASGNGKKEGSVDSASANQQQSVLNSFTPRSALRQLQAFKGLSNEQAAPLADVQSIEVSSLKNTTQSEASIDSAMAKFDVDRFNEEVGKILKNQLVNSFTGKNISVKMLLSPESLGQVEVDLLFSKDSEIQITLRTENAEVAKLMQANATVLRDQLAIEHKGNVALNINDSRTAEFGFQGNQRDEANREKYSVFDESDSGESNNALEKSSISGDGSNSLIDTFA